MKTFALSGFMIFIHLFCFSYTWNPIGPDTAHVSRLCFNVGAPYTVICAGNGMYLYNYGTQDCLFFTYGNLPVVGACYMDPGQLLVAMGNGSWSDGIYRFNLETHTFEIVMWAPYPNFLEYHEPSGTYWLGTQFGGLFVSENGLEWTALPYFEGKSCTCYDSYGERMVVSELSNLYNIYCSDDSGNTWYQSAFPLMISDMKFDSWGKLWGIFPDYSDSSGLWFSVDYGNNWEVSFYGENMSAVGLDAFGNLFVGWKEELGIARYDQTAPPPGLTFLNNGLPEASINRIQLNPVMSAPAIFICTDSGAYYSYDYMVGKEDLITSPSPLYIYPNPASDKLTVSCKCTIHEISVFTMMGDLVSFSKPGINELHLRIEDLSEGIYVVYCRTDSGIIARKWILFRQN